MKAERPHIVIIGGGFGGLYTAKALRNAPVCLTLVDRRNHHLFQPLLYQVATAGLNPADIASPIRRILRKQKNTEVLMGEATGVNIKEKKVILTDRELPYDYLVIATGATHSYFGHEEWAEFAPGLKSIEDALDIRRRILSAYEMAEREGDPAQQSAWMTFVIVGAGPTGVELAGTMAEIARHALREDFRHIDPARSQILLIEGAPRVLPTYIEELSEKARQQLIKLGVDVRTGLQVTAIDAEGVTTKNNQRIAARTVLWAAGVAASPLARSLSVPLDRAGRVLVEPDLTAPGTNNVFVIGDLMALQPDGQPIPGVAPAAIQAGRHTARNILRACNGQPLEPFHYIDKGSLATIGRAAAVADLGKIKLSGFTAWLTWLLIHIFFLIGFRNRFIVLFEWAWSYLTYDRGARLITNDMPQQPAVARHKRGA